MRYKLQRDHRVLDLDKMVFVDSNEFWYQELSTGDIWSLCQIITHVEETEGESRRLMLLDDMSLVFEDAVPGDVPLAVPVRETFIPPITDRCLVLTDDCGREVVSYRADKRYVDPMFGDEAQRINFLSPMDMRRLTVEDLEGNGNDHRLDNLKEFMRMLVAAARLWEK